MDSERALLRAACLGNSSQELLKSEGSRRADAFRCKLTEIFARRCSIAGGDP